MKSALLALLVFALPLQAADDRKALAMELVTLLEVKNHAMYSWPEGEFRNRMMAKLDPVTLAEEVYVPAILERCSEKELRELIAFYKTRAGQKAVALMPHLYDPAMLMASPYMLRVVEEVREEAQRDAAKNDPLKAVLQQLRTIATAVESRATDTNEYPNVSFAELEPLLEPTYIRDVPRVDPWGTPYEYIADGNNYRIVSAGADRRFEPGSRLLDVRQQPPRVTDDLDADIIFQNGNVIQYPRQATPGE